MRCVSTAALVLALCAGATGSRAMDCRELMPPETGVSQVRDVTADDLVGLRDIGTAWIWDPASPILSVSPDGSKVAFALRRAKAADNDYCQGIVVVGTDRGASPLQVNAGGRFLRMRQTLLGVTDYPSGYAQIVTPKWSPDGGKVAFLRQDEGAVQVWIADLQAGTSRPVTKVAFDVEAFEWSGDGAAMVVSGRPGLANAVADIEEEGGSGFLFDERYVPFASDRPFPLDGIPTKSFSVDLATGGVQEIVRDKGANASALVSAAGVVDLSGRTLGPGGRSAWLVPTEAGNVVSPGRIHASDAKGKNTICAEEACLRAKVMWWTTDGSLVFQRREGWGWSLTGLYVWSPRNGQVRQVLQTPDVLVGCQVTGARLICGREGSLRPREVVAIDLATGAETVLFNPNPEVRNWRVGAVERLHWTNAAGVETFGDLVLPSDHRPGQRLPLVVVQYESRGFLRGGTGDDYPIQLFARAGLAVLRIETPVSSAYFKGAPSHTALFSAERVGWQHRREIQSSLEGGIALAVAKGVVDGERVGITGYSDGAQTVRFALINSRAFKAASVSSCCEDQTSIMSLYGLKGGAEMRSYGYPGLTDDGAAFWAPTSTRHNAARMDTPVLMQLRDKEYLASLESYMSLRERGQPAELYVFPDEFHQIWQPEHRKAIYTRNVDWFRFWLMNTRDPDPSKAVQYERWQSLKDRHLKATGAAPG